MKETSSEILEMAGVNLTSSSEQPINFLPLSTPTTRPCSPRSGRQSPTTTKMLPPVRFNILGKIQKHHQRRKPPSPVVSTDKLLSSPSPNNNHETGKVINPQLTPRSSPLQQQQSSRLTDSPIDFSKKPKLELIDIQTVENSDDTAPSSPSFRLRNILSMKSVGEDPEKVLNLSSKESAPSPLWLEKFGQTDSLSADSLSCSPVPVESRHSLLPQSPPIRETKTDVHPALCSAISTQLIQSSTANHVLFPHYGLFTPVSSVRVSHAGTLPLKLEPLPIESAAFPPNLALNPPATASHALPAPIPLPHTDSATSKTRVTRPFKAYPKDPMSFSTVGLYGLPLGTMPGTTEALIHQQSNAAYAEFRKQMLSQSNVHRTRRGNHRGILGNDINPRSPSIQHHFAPNSPPNGGQDMSEIIQSNGKSVGKSEQQLKDEAYWERRRKNNEAAKRSRDARRAKEDEIAIRAAFLEQENLKLRFELCALKNETAKLRCMLYSS